ncbi:MICOS complex subunit MIC60 isoform X3 [Conger conger]|uniref:MICOS complex subunit MIC60 isoform X3 n=1 Tax=Conger conger TaxID=82655 RepID=UPI002A59896A|nr:MICOS complex subunit MIC60 isoform X3 [Conger conger]
MLRVCRKAASAAAQVRTILEWDLVSYCHSLTQRSRPAAQIEKIESLCGSHFKRYQKCLCGNVPLRPLQPCRRYTSAGDTGVTAGKIVGASLLVVGGGLGGTILYAKWDPKFRANMEKSVPYSDQVFEMTLGPSTYSLPLPKKPVSSKELKPPKVMGKSKVEEEPAEAPAALEPSPPLPPPQTTEEASVEAAHIISTISEVPSVPAPVINEPEPQPEALPPAAPDAPAGECTECAHEAQHAVKERPPEEVAARLAEQDKAEEDHLASLSASLEEALGSSAEVTLKALAAQNAAIEAINVHTQRLKDAMEDEEASPDKKAMQWRVLEDALKERSKTVDEAADALQTARTELEKLRGVIDHGKKANLSSARAQILAAEENLHNMLVDLDNMVNKVTTAQGEAKILSQYNELVTEAKTQFQKELDSITPEIQSGWKGLTGKLSADDLNSLIAHAHRRIDQLNRELAEQRVREQIHIESALEQQKLENKKALEVAVATALEHNREEMRLEQQRKVEEVRGVMEAEMRTQLRRQAAAHTDHLRDVLKVQEQELHAEAQENLSNKLMDQETEFRRQAQEQLDGFTLDMNAAYARLKGMEEAIDTHMIAEEEARKAHQLWLSVEALNYSLRLVGVNAPTEPLETAVRAVRESCSDNEFALALTTALPEESLQRGIYSEASLRARFYRIRQLARRVAMIDETRNSLYQYFLSYLQSVLLFEPKQAVPPAKLSSEDHDTFKLLSYATYCLEHGDLELAAKLVNQLRGESRRVAQDWLKEARLTLETRQVVSLLSAYANAVGLGTTQAP